MNFILKLIKWCKRPEKSSLAQWVEAFVVVLPIVFIVRTFLYGLYQVPTGSMEPTLLIGERFLADKCTVWFSNPKRGDIISFNDPTFKYSDNSVVEFVQRYVWIPFGYAPDNWTKRIIAIPGDHIKGDIENGRPEIYLNGKKLNEPYVNSYPLLGTMGGFHGWTHKTYDPQFSFHNQPFYRFEKYDVIRAASFFKRLSKIENIDIPEILYPHTPVQEDWQHESDIFEHKLADDEYFCLGDNRLGSYDSRGWGPLKAKNIHGKIFFRIWSHDSSESWFIVDLIMHPIDFWKRIRWSRCLQIVK